jgi:hypothetical protein
MTEPTAPEPIPAETLRTLAVAELTTIQNLLVYLDLDGLRFVRNRLHSPDLVRVCDEGPLAETRAVLLDTTCRALVAVGWAPEQYFLECADMFPRAPDTIAEDGALPLLAPPPTRSLTNWLRVWRVGRKHVPKTGPSSLN